MKKGLYDIKKNDRKKDVLLIARPDHSMQIYESLLFRKSLTFKYVTFKVIPEYLKKMLRIKRIQAVSKYCSISICATFIHTFNFNFNFRYKFKTMDCLNKKVSNELKANQYKIIHYWPEYCTIIADYKRKNPNVITFADIYMPNPAFIMQTMEILYKKYNMPNNAYLSDYSHQLKLHLKEEDNIVVASSYVVDTMKIAFPEKNYFIVPLGITIYKRYEKKASVTSEKEVKNFVYVGTISIEKGCDLLCEWFFKHPGYNIHLYGKMAINQQFIFEKYQKVSNIIFHGSVIKSELQHYIKNYDVGIHLSRFDAYSLAVGEVIGCGIPVIVSNYTGNKDDVLHFGFGMITQLEERDITASILSITAPVNYNTYIDNIDHYIRSNPKSYGNRMVDLYESLIHKTTSRKTDQA
jgi:glycosyltransferase involved in cell wall biosynthesis